MSPKEEALHFGVKAISPFLKMKATNKETEMKASVRKVY